MILDCNGNIRDAGDVDGERAAECELTEHTDPAARKSFLVMLMSQGLLAGKDEAYSACELELDELLQEA